MAIANRLPDLARQTAAVFDSQGQGHPILGQIVTLIDQRCELTQRRISAPASDSVGDDADHADDSVPGAD